MILKSIFDCHALILHNFESFNNFIFKVNATDFEFNFKRKVWSTIHLLKYGFERISSSFKTRRPVITRVTKKHRNVSGICSVAHPSIGPPWAENKRFLHSHAHACTIENLLFVAGRRCINPGRSQPSQRWIVSERCQERIREKARSGEERKGTVRHATSATKLA